MTYIDFHFIHNNVCYHLCLLFQDNVPVVYSASWSVWAESPHQLCLHLHAL